MAASTATVVASMDAMFADNGILYDGNTDGMVDNLTFDQLQTMIRIVKSVGGNVTVTNGIMFIKPVPTDTSAA